MRGETDGATMPSVIILLQRKLIFKGISFNFAIFCSLTFDFLLFAFFP